MPPSKPVAFAITDDEIDEFTRESAKILRSGILILGGILTASTRHPRRSAGCYCRVLPKHGSFTLVDEVHAHGSQPGGVKPGNPADAVAFMFFPTKVMTTCRGGMITTNSGGEGCLARSFLLAVGLLLGLLIPLQVGRRIALRRQLLELRESLQ